MGKSNLASSKVNYGLLGCIDLHDGIAFQPRRCLQVTLPGKANLHCYFQLWLKINMRDMQPLVGLNSHQESLSNREILMSSCLSEIQTVFTLQLARGTEANTIKCPLST